ncbi:Uncharacterized protein APZ42_021538 [Daphnia magna]|uniref:Uncharacterized protein n=1 Tax=Daphnia magna TaxID=35525 RepID=A0A164WKR0_9CRUS|nr:Uncharacterized protein APZ42_021538 [Daphnia magna]
MSIGFPSLFSKKKNKKTKQKSTKKTKRHALCLLETTRACPTPVKGKDKLIITLPCCRCDLHGNPKLKKKKRT